MGDPISDSLNLTVPATSWDTSCLGHSLCPQPSLAHSRCSNNIWHQYCPPGEPIPFLQPYCEVGKTEVQSRLLIKKIFECVCVPSSVLGAEDTRQTWYMSYTHIIINCTDIKDVQHIKYK